MIRELERLTKEVTAAMETLQAREREILGCYQAWIVHIKRSEMPKQTQ